MTIRSEVTITDTTLRDGIQGARFIETPLKLAAMEKLARTGIQCIEVASFVNPSLFPQFADAEAVVRQAISMNSFDVSAFVANARGVHRAVEVGVKQVNASSSLDAVREAQRNGISCRAYLSCATNSLWFEAEAAADCIKGIEALLIEGAGEVVLADEGDVARREEIDTFLRKVDKAGIPLSRVALHLHTGSGNAVNKVDVALDRGIRKFDSTSAGLGGMSATSTSTGWAGNIATGDLVDACDRHSLTTGINGRLADNAALGLPWLERSAS